MESYVPPESDVTSFAPPKQGGGGQQRDSREEKKKKKKHYDDDDDDEESERERDKKEKKRLKKEKRTESFDKGGNHSYDKKKGSFDKENSFDSKKKKKHDYDEDEDDEETQNIRSDYDYDKPPADTRKSLLFQVAREASVRVSAIGDAHPEPARATMTAPDDGTPISFS